MGKSIHDYREGTGRDPSWMGEAVEEGEPQRGYIESDRQAPTFLLKKKLLRQKNIMVEQWLCWQGRLLQACKILTSKQNILVLLENMQVNLNLACHDLEKLLLTSIDDARYGDLESIKKSIKLYKRYPKHYLRKKLLAKQNL